MSPYLFSAKTEYGLVQNIAINISDTIQVTEPFKNMYPADDLKYYFYFVEIFWYGDMIIFSYSIPKMI